MYTATAVLTGKDATNATMELLLLIKTKEIDEYSQQMSWATLNERRDMHLCMCAWTAMSISQNG